MIAKKMRQAIEAKIFIEPVDKIAEACADVAKEFAIGFADWCATCAFNRINTDKNNSELIELYLDTLSKGKGK